MANDFTPGPWHARTGPVPSDQAIVFPSYDEDGPIADCFSYDYLRPAKECQANARLIAAAPAMHPVCKAVLAAFEAQRDPIPDSDLDDEQPISLNVRLTLGDVRKMRRVLP